MNRQKISIFKFRTFFLRVLTITCVRTVRKKIRSVFFEQKVLELNSEKGFFHLPKADTRFLKAQK